MNSTKKIAVRIAAVASLGIAAAAFAQGTPPAQGYGPGPGVGQHGMGPMAGMPGPGMVAPFDPAAMAEARLTRIKATLKITGDQEAAWAAFADAVKAQSERMKVVRAAAVREAKSTVPERMAQHIAMAKLHVANMEALQTPVNALYAKLADDQKAIADTLLGRMHQRRRGPGL